MLRDLLAIEQRVFGTCRLEMWNAARKGRRFSQANAARLRCSLSRVKLGTLKSKVAETKKVPMATPRQIQAEDDLALDQIAGHVSEGKCILFLGAGVHYPPPEGSPYSYPESDRPPLGSALSKELAEECGFKKKFRRESEEDLQRVSLCYEINKSRKQLVEKIIEKVDVGRKPSPVVRAPFY